MAKRTVKYSRSGVSKLPNDKPAVYRIKTAGGRTNYVGVAKRGRVQERIKKHLTLGKIPGASVHIEQVSSIHEATRKEQNIISRTKPKYNKQEKAKGPPRGTPPARK